MSQTSVCQALHHSVQAYAASLADSIPHHRVPVAPASIFRSLALGHLLGGVDVHDLVAHADGQTPVLSAVCTDPATVLAAWPAMLPPPKNAQQAPTARP